MRRGVVTDKVPCHLRGFQLVMFVEHGSQSWFAFYNLSLSIGLHYGTPWWMAAPDFREMETRVTVTYELSRGAITLSQEAQGKACHQ
jgi:hypothetical protein